jgi:hypothetical protein
MSRLQCPSEGEEAERHQRVVPFIERVTGHRLLFTSTLGMGFFSWTVEYQRHPGISGSGLTIVVVKWG